jgi:hypothetical protein
MHSRVHTTALFFIRAEFAKSQKKERSGAQQQPTIGVDYNTLFIMENKN